MDHLRSGVQNQPGQHGETPFLLKLQKISQAWWQALVIPATQEAEAEELLELRRWRLQPAEITPLHSSLGSKSKTPSQKICHHVSICKQETTLLRTFSWEERNSTPLTLKVTSLEKTWI